ncbi:hypothetical protein [Haloarcula sp. JP-Z28]|nr:hypothetical protein [Haloarcula sp. JP-Z28]
MQRVRIDRVAQEAATFDRDIHLFDLDVADSDASVLTPSPA